MRRDYRHYYRLLIKPTDNAEDDYHVYVVTRKLLNTDDLLGTLRQLCCWGKISESVAKCCAAIQRTTKMSVVWETM